MRIQVESEKFRLRSLDPSPTLPASGEGAFSPPQCGGS